MIRKLYWMVATIVFLSTSAPLWAAEDGFYIGGSVGNAYIQDSAPDTSEFENIDFNSDDTGYKLFGGFRGGFFGVEGGYVSFGSPTDRSTKIEMTAFDLFALIAFSAGPVDIFGKAGAVKWDRDTTVDGQQISTDGTDPVYGAGVALNIGSLGIRGEYELYDIGDTNDVYMISVGATVTF